VSSRFVVADPARNMLIGCAVLGVLFSLDGCGRNLSDEAPDRSRTLVAYRISPEQEAPFFEKDGSLGAVWNAWKTRPLSFAYLHPGLGSKARSDSVSEPFKDQFDAQVQAMAAYGDRGLFLRFDVIDDDYPGDAAFRTSWANDNVELMIDDFAAESLYARPGIHLPFGGHELTKSNVQIQYSMGGSAPATHIRVNRYDTTRNLAAIQTGTFLERSYPLADARDSLGIIVRTSFYKSSMRRQQEWFIPWPQVGFKGTHTRPSQGSSRAMVINYNDFDTLFLRAGVKSIKKLTWGDRGNPYDAGRQNVWGNLQFGPWLTGPGYTVFVNDTVSGSVDTFRIQARQAVEDDQYCDGYMQDRLSQGSMDLSCLFENGTARLFLQDKEILCFAATTSRPVLSLVARNATLRVSSVSVASKIRPLMYEGFSADQFPKWYVQSGSWNTMKDRFGQTVLGAKPNSDTSCAISCGKAFWRDYRMQVAIRAPRERVAGISIVLKDDGSGAELSYDPATDRTQVVRTTNAGETTHRLSLHSLVPDEWYKLWLAKVGDTLSAGIGHTELLRIRDTSASCGNVRLSASKAGNLSMETVFFDDIFVDYGTHQSETEPESLVYKFDDKEQFTTDLCDWFASQCKCSLVGMGFLLEFDNQEQRLNHLLYKEEISTSGIRVKMGDFRYGERNLAFADTGSFAMIIGLAKDPTAPHKSFYARLHATGIDIVEGGRVLFSRAVQLKNLESAELRFDDNQTKVLVDGLQVLAWSGIPRPCVGHPFVGFEGRTAQKIQLDRIAITGRPRLGDGRAMFFNR